MNKYNISSAQLQQPLSIQDLINGDVHFKIKENVEEAMENLDLEGDVIDAEKCADNLDTELPRHCEFSFSELKFLMSVVSEYIHKRILIPGSGDVVPENSKVTLEYSVYFDGETKPYDSSLFNDSKFQFVLGSDIHYQGLQDAIKTMKKGEKSEFLISNKLLWGPQGVYREIKPNTDALYRITLFDFEDVGDAAAIDKMTAEEKLKFAFLSGEVQKVIENAKSNFKEKRYHRAIRIFHEVVTSLEICTMANEAEELEHKKLLYTVFRNLAVCYNRISNPQKVLTMIKSMKKLRDISGDSKALFQHGRALILTGEYDMAKSLLHRAYHLNPDDTIEKELILLDQKYKAYKENIGGIWQKALNNKENLVINEEAKVEVPKLVHTSDRFRDHMTKFIADFKKSDKSVEEIKFNLSIDDIHVIEEIVDDMSDIEFTDIDNGRLFQIAKI